LEACELINKGYQIPRISLIWIMASIALVIAPHVPRLPLWIVALIIVCMAWRLLIFQGKLAYPGCVAKVLIVLITLPLTVLQYRGQGLGLDAAVCLLIMGVVFKLLEMCTRRDMMIVVTLTYVLIMVGFIYSQTILTSVHALLLVIVITGALVSLNRDNSHSTIVGNSRVAIRLVLQSIPLSIALFVLVPRVAPLWSMPSPASATKTGVTDEMTPGSITNLGRSAELAFRVSFEGEIPPHEELYWRGLVLDFFDGQTWRRAGSSFLSFNMISRFPTEFLGTPRGAAIDYDVVLEPTQQSWIYALQLAQFNDSDIVQDRNYTLHTSTPITQRFRYQIRSHLLSATDVELPGVLLARGLQLPDVELNPRTQAFAKQMRNESTDERDFVMRILGYFREQPFYYTLNPPRLGDESIDEFLFSTREGFCGHYAGSFVYMMRAAGIPARVVVGYQGGEYNPFENYTMVYQYNAHAWAEVWLEGEGWVRFDPTAAVAPERISLGVEAVFANQPGFMEDSRFSMIRFRDTQWLNSLRLRLDALDYAWNRWVVSYDEDLQFALLEDLFGTNARAGVLLVLFASICVLLGIVAVVLLGGNRRVRHDPATRLYLGLADELAKVGLARKRGEGPRDYCERICHHRADIGPQMRELTDFYQQLNYGNAVEKLAAAQSHDSHTLALLRQSIYALRRRLGSSDTSIFVRFWKERF
jgi:transglutaminase-like putative cysteine protease